MESDNLLPPLTPELNVRDLTKNNRQMIGVRQFMVMDPDGFLLRFGKRIGSKPIEATGGRH
jgi:hypothetical protein